MTPGSDSPLGRFATRNALSIVFISAALCLAGIYCALHMPSSVFPQTNFPRVVILIDNGIMPADEMMATVTRPIEEVLKDIPGALTVRSATKRGSAQVNVFFDWRTDMSQAELYVLGRLSQIRGELPATATTEIERVTFSAFPIIGISLTSSNRNITSLWETASYELKPRFLQIPGVARVEIKGGREPEYHVVVDPLKLEAVGLSLSEVAEALTNNNVYAPAGMMEENYHLYLTTVDGRVHSIEDIQNLVVAFHGSHPVQVKDLASVARGAEPVFQSLTAQGRDAVLLNIQSQPEGSILDIATALKEQLRQLRRELPPDMRLSFFYDQSLFVRDSVRSVWDAILFGLILSALILFCFLKNWGSVWTAIVTIPITLLITLVAMKMAGMSFNMMTLGGIAASIGMVIDDAIVVVEAMFVKIASGRPRLAGIQEAIGEILRPLVASTLTPVVVFIPLAFLTGIAGVFFRALALTMVVSLLTSLVLALTLTPSLAAWLMRERKDDDREIPEKNSDGGFLLRRVNRLYEWALRMALRLRLLALIGCVALAAGAVSLYQHLETDFLPDFDEGGFIIDFHAPPGTSLTETSRQLDQAERILAANPDVEGYSRRLGAELGMFITEAYRGDFAVKLKTDRKHPTDQVIAELRHTFNEQFPAFHWEFPGILTDVIGDLQMAPEPVEIKLFSPDLKWLQKVAPQVEEQTKSVHGIVDTFNGLTETGPSFNFRVNSVAAAQFGLSAQEIASAVNTALLGQTASYVLEGDRIVNIRVLVNRASVSRIEALGELPLRAGNGTVVRLSQVAEMTEEPSPVELDRDDLRQDIVVTARLEGRDLGSAMKEIREKLSQINGIPRGAIEYGGLYQQQQESFRNLLAVLLAAILLVFIVLLIEFRSFNEPISIVFGAVLAMSGTIAALWLTHTSLNIVSFLGAIIGVGIVAKNGILMLDFVQQMESEGLNLADALVRSGHRRLRPVLMTSCAAALGMLPLAWSVGSGAEMLRPLAIAVIGALCISVLLSLVATPMIYFILRRIANRGASPR